MSCGQCRRERVWRHCLWRDREAAARPGAIANLPTGSLFEGPADLGTTSSCRRPDRPVAAIPVSAGVRGGGGVAGDRKVAGCSG